MSDVREKNAAVPASQERIAQFNQRFDFGSYAETRQFLDDLAELSKREAYYPDVSFGKTYANVSIDGEGQAALLERKSTFIADMRALTAKKEN
ncbi:MAG TPA: hypothetical protein VFN66_01225 [Burkholderiales bacterium]|nr:hypothetical protein [Burkholderiales bacterium]